jgi:hypothetical protein
MKIKCIDNENCDDLTIGKIYEVFEIYDGYYRIIDDDNNKDWYHKS